MLDRALPDLHGIRVPFKPLLHVIDYDLLLPPRVSAPLASRVPVLEQTGLGFRASIRVERHAFLNPGETPDQALTRWATVLILLPVIHKV
jgi:hypothetical protein